MEYIKRNRRGFLLAEETLKIIIAVICILFLIGLLAAIYNANTSTKKIDEAKSVLSRVNTIIFSLEEGATERQDVPNPQGWHIYSFTGEEKPNSCVNSNCLCICANSQIEIITSQATKCDKEGACLVIPALATADLDLKITGANNLLFIGIKKQNGGILIGKVK